MEKIPTVDDFLNEEYYHIILDSRDTWINVGDIKRAMIQFAKLHVEAALKEASEKSKVDIGKNYTVDEITLHPTLLIATVTIKANKDSILNSYSLDNIK